METHNITINIGHRLAELQVITDTNINEAVTEALVAKVTWEEDRERELRELSERHTEEMRRVEGELEEERRRGEAALEEARRGEERARQVTQTLQTQLSEAEARGRMDKRDREELEQRVQQIQEEQRAAEERVATLRGKLREEKTKGDKRLAAITRRYEEEKKRVEEQVMTFVIQVEDVHRQLLERQHHDEERLSDVIQRLFSQFNIRLLGTDCGLRFLLDAPVSQWVKVVENQLEIQAVLSASDTGRRQARRDVDGSDAVQTEC
nr:hypothetical protein BaRGS_003110 [Batillaria attramentaria]